jgi:hypothetical protein
MWARKSTFRPAISHTGASKLDLQGIFVYKRVVSWREARELRRSLRDEVDY